MKAKWLYLSVFLFLLLLLGSFNALKAEFIPPLFSFSDFPYNNSLNDSVLNLDFNQAGETTLEQNSKNSQSFYGTRHLLATQSISPQARQKPISNDWVIWVVIVSLGLLSVSRLFFPHRSRQFVKATLGGRHFNQMERDGNYFDETPAWLFFTNYLLIFSLLVFQTLTKTKLFSDSLPAHPWLLFLVILAAFVVYLPLKAAFTSFLAWVFGTKSANLAYTKNTFLYNSLTGLLLLPLVVYNAYNYSQTGIFIGWVLVITINFAKILRGSGIGFAQVRLSAYYLILYLCAVELAPLLIFLKTVKIFLIPG
jgi:hypothetical protein